MCIRDSLKTYSKNERCSVSTINILDDKQREGFIQKSDIVISMLPARFHIILAKSCLKLKKNLLTASYVGDEMKKLNMEVIGNNLIFLLNKIHFERSNEELKLNFLLYWPVR